MTADIDANNHNHNHGEVRESEEVVVVVAHNGGEHCCDSDVEGVLPKINCNKDDVEGSYVFVTGHGDGDDLVESDLESANDNKPGVEEVLAVSQFQAEEKDNGGRENEASGSPADEHNSRSLQEVDDGQIEGGGKEIHESDIGVKNSDELGLAESVEKDQESEIGVDNDESSNNVPSDNANREVEKVEESSNEIPMNGSGDDQEQEDLSKVSSLGSKIKLDLAIEEIPIPGDIGNGFPDGSKEVSVEGSKEHNLETTSNSETHIILETEATDGPLSEQQNGESLPADFAQESLLQTAVVTEKNGSPTALDDEKPLSLSEEAPVEGSKGDNEEVLKEHSLEMPSSSGGDKALEREVANGPLLEQNGEELPPGLARESLSETAVVSEKNGSPTALDNENPLTLSKESPVEGSQGDLGEVLEEPSLETPLSSGGNKALETEVADGPLLEQNGEDLPPGPGEESLSETPVVSEQNGSPRALDNETRLTLSKESPVEGSKGDVGEVLEEHSLEMSSSSGGDKALETECANGPLLERNGDNLPPGLAQESLPETAVVSEQNGSPTALHNGNPLTLSKESPGEGSQGDVGEVLEEHCLETPSSSGGDEALEMEVANGPSLEQNEEDLPSGLAPESLLETAVVTEQNGSSENAECLTSPLVCSGAALETDQSLPGVPVNDIIGSLDAEDVRTENDTVDVADVDVNFEHLGSDVKSASQEAEGFEGKKMDKASTLSQENLGQTIDGDHKDEEASTALPEGTSDGQNVGVEEVKKRLYYFIRIPWYDDENLREQIKRAELEVEERTKIRGAIHAKVQTQRVIVKEYADNVQASLTEERAARDFFKSKRQEFDSVQLVISKVKNAQSVEDIHAKIRSMELMIEHETLPLKEEKQLIREIKQLKQQCEQLSSNMGKQDEVKQALDQKDQIEERLKGLRKELDLLREKISKAEEVTQTARKKLNVENDKLNELLYQFRDADGIRQEAYAHFKSLKDKHSEKIKRFKGYKNASTAAQKLALSKDKEQLQHCIDQAEKFMEIWNRDDDFRKDYVRNNTRSTLRRLGTLDGRSLGPDEKPPVIPDVVVNNKAANNNSVSLTKIPEQEKQGVPAKVEKPDDKSGAKVVERENQTVKTKKPAKPGPSPGTSPVAISDKDERKEEERKEEEPRRSREEEELARRAEELRKEEEEANLKQRRNLEERAKAKEAMERKKKIAEKAQAKAAFRAQKDAEEKEKKREKRARKKERKKANGADPRNEEEGGESAPNPSPEVPSPGAQPESEKPATMVKRPQKAQQFTKQIRTRSVALPPPLLRNRGKRRMQPWMWVALAVAIVLALFLCWPSCMHWFGF